MVNSTTIAGVAPYTGTAYVQHAPAGAIITSTGSAGSAGDTELPTFQFIAGWLLLLLILYGISRTRVGYVAIYYVLLLAILFLLVTEYAVITPLLNSVQSLGQFNTSTTNIQQKGK